MHLIRDVWLVMKGIIRAARKIVAAELEPLGLSSSEGDLLFLLLTGSSGLRQEELAEQLDVDKAAISRTVKSLEAKGYVLRIKDAEDKRAFSISLTEKALAVSSQITAIYDRLYQLVQGNIPSEEFLRMESLLAQIAGNLETWGNR